MTKITGNLREGLTGILADLTALELAYLRRYIRGSVRDVAEAYAGHASEQAEIFADLHNLRDDMDEAIYVRHTNGEVKEDDAIEYGSLLAVAAAAHGEYRLRTYLGLDDNASFTNVIDEAEHVLEDQGTDEEQRWRVNDALQALLGIALPDEEIASPVADDEAHATSQRCCPDDTDRWCNGVIVTHETGCSHGEPRMYVWQECGALMLGNLATYARSWEESQYGHFDPADLTSEVRTWDTTYQIEIISLGTSDDYMRYRLKAGDESVLVNVDGRV